ncbi:Stp1/IreP family PP2C-type Ser/Thr phosphatase [Tessaracoccus lubricantis]|uniref:Stp1/IreP family PP2C-type Ser/Thr phosphatase n=1 Tax=Tessaracoccus lubricantis TaxID=545543 RepID=A0ABP9FGG0_9ACTN
MTFSLRFTAHSEVGRIRKNNQDAGYASPTMLLVADGMGGAAAGDLASAVASTEAARSDAHDEVRAADGEELLARIAGMIARSNTKLTDLIESNLELDGMGTTFCGALFNGTQFGLAHIGDSRGYLLRDGELTQLTHDHSWVQSLIDEGKITPEQAATHPHRSLILKVLNGQVHFEPDLEVHEARLGDRLMFCSDGLSGLVDDDVIQQVLQDEDLDAAVATLARFANDNGGHDNITIVIGEVVEHDDELDAVPALLVGSATEVEIPRAGGPVALPTGHGYPSTPSDVKVEHDAEEAARYAPTEGRRRWPGIIATIVAIALVVGGGWWATSSYVASRYFISADDGQVAVFNGVPGNVLGVTLNNLVERTDIPVEDLPHFFRGEVEASITVGSIEAAERTVGSLRDLAEACVAIREERRAERDNPPASESPSPSPEPSGGPSVSPEPTQSPEEEGPGLPSSPQQTGAPSSPVTAAVPPLLAPFTPEPVETPTLAEELATLEPGPGEEADLEDC